MAANCSADRQRERYREKRGLIEREGGREELYEFAGLNRIYLYNDLKSFEIPQDVQLYQEFDENSTFSMTLFYSLILFTSK